MFILEDIKNWLFFDIETVSRCRTLEVLESTDPTNAKLWRHRCEYLRRRYIECEKMTDDELYIEKAGLHPEFSKIVCISMGIYKGGGQAQIVGYASDDEKEVVSKALGIIDQFKKTVYNKSRTAVAYLAGHNIKRFDVPVLCKRALINKLELPDMLQIHGKKPWEMIFMDTAEVWSFGAWQESFASLDLLANVLGLESSKGDMAGNMVQSAYWNDNDLAKIKEYCQNDVIVTMNVVLSLSGLEPVTFANATRV